MAETGWIKLHRSFLDWEWFDDARMVHVWLFLLCSASRQNGNWRGQYVKRGQIITSVKSIAKKCSLSEQNVRTIIKRLKSTNEITSETTNNFTIITICKYDDYQTGEELTNEQNNKPTNKRLTNGQQTTNKRLTTSKEVKNIRSKEYIERSSNEDPKTTKSNPLENGDLKNSENPNNLPKEPKSEKEKSSAKKEKVDFRAKLIEIGVTEQTADDWLQVRRTKRATNTATALNKTLEQLRLAYKAGYSPEECIRIATERDWRGFEYEWMVNLKNTSNGTTASNRQPHARPTDNERREGYAAALNEIVNGSDPTTTPIL